MSTNVPIRRYERLEAHEQHAAHTLARYCRVHSDTTSAIGNQTTLAIVGFMQSIATSAPLVASDMAVLWFVLLSATGAAERLLGLPTTTVTSQTAFLSSIMMVPLGRMAGMYPGFGMNPVVEFRNILRCVAMALLIFTGVGATTTNNWVFFITSAVIAYVLSIVVFPSARFLTRSFASILPGWGAPLLIYGPRSIATDLYQRLHQTPDRGFLPAGILLSPDEYWELEETDTKSQIPTFDVRSALEAASDHNATWVLITNDVAIDDPELNAGLLAIPNRIHLASLTFDMGPWDRLCTVGSACGFHVGGSIPKSFKQALKRGFDLVLTGLGLLILSPLLAFIGLAVKFSSKGPIFYGQQRVGKDGQMFTAWKFRSMVPNADQVLDAYLNANPEARTEWEHSHLLQKDPRVTWIGRFLRKTSFDEFPQLWNILKGEMSLVGPRPIINSPNYDQCYVVDYPHEYNAYKSVRPGLTGLWQVSCRNAGVYEKRIYWDMYYIRNWSLWLDLYIILRTIRTVVLREGAA